MSRSKDEIKALKGQLDLTCHSVFNGVAQAVQKIILRETGMEVVLQGKYITPDGGIKATLSGEKLDEEGNLGQKVEAAMTRMRNPSVITDNMKG
jgi:hypothetical protein